MTETASAPAPAEQQTAEQAAEQQQIAELENWIKAGFGDRPYVGTREEMQALPEAARMEIARRYPSHYEKLMADKPKLSAELQLRMAKKQLLFTDLEELQNSGFAEAVQWLTQQRKAAAQQHLEQMIEAQQQESAERNKRLAEESAQHQQELLQRANQTARATYLRQLHGGDKYLMQPTGPVRIG